MSETIHNTYSHGQTNGYNQLDTIWSFTQLVTFYREGTVSIQRYSAENQISQLNMVIVQAWWFKMTANTNTANRRSTLRIPSEALNHL